MVSRHHQVQDAIQSRLTSRRRELQEVVNAGGPDAAAAHATLAQLDASGQLSAGEDRFLTHATRTNQQPVTRADLDTAWTQTATGLGLTARDLDALQQNDRPQPTPNPERLEAQLTEHDATLTRSHARAIALEQSAGLPIRDALLTLAQMRDSDRLLTLADGTLTTHAHRTREQQTAALAARLTAADVDPIPPSLVEQNAARLDGELHASGGSLSTEQRAALSLACSDGQLVIIEGHAGTGKSTVLTGVARAHEAAGQNIIVTAPPPWPRNASPTNSPPPAYIPPRTPPSPSPTPSTTAGHPRPGDDDHPRRSRPRLHSRATRSAGQRRGVRGAADPDR